VENTSGHRLISESPIACAVCAIVTVGWVLVVHGRVRTILSHPVRAGGVFGSGFAALLNAVGMS
jgi:hypothetical protein